MLTARKSNKLMSHIIRSRQGDPTPPATALCSTLSQTHTLTRYSTSPTYGGPVAQSGTKTLPLVDDAYATHMCDLVPCRPKTKALTCSPLI